MKILLILGHPDKGSLNSRIAQEAAETLESAGHDVAFHDLYDEGFDPVLPLEDLRRRASFAPLPSRYAEELVDAGGLLVVHPDWWGLPPAIVKGWVDRIFLPGVAFSYEEAYGEGMEPFPLLRGLQAAVVVTRDGGSSRLCEEFWMNAVFGFCGVEKKAFFEIGPLKRLEGAEKERRKSLTTSTLVSFFSEDGE